MARSVPASDSDSSQPTIHARQWRSPPDPQTCDSPRVVGRDAGRPRNAAHRCLGLPNTRSVGLPCHDAAPHAPRRCFVRASPCVLNIPPGVSRIRPFPGDAGKRRREHGRVSRHLMRQWRPRPDPPIPPRPDSREAVLSRVEGMAKDGRDRPTCLPPAPAPAALPCPALLATPPAWPWCMDRRLGSEEVYSDLSYLCSEWVGPDDKSSQLTGKMRSFRHYLCYFEP